MAIVEALLTQLGKQGLKVVPGIGIPLFLTDTLYKVAEAAKEETRDRAREHAKCPHIEVCKGSFGATPTTAMVEYVAKLKGMAFRYGGVALCHPQAGWDLHGISCQDVLRWDGRYVTGRATGLHLTRCVLCHPQ